MSRLAPLKLRERNSASGSIGAGERSSTSRNTSEQDDAGDAGQVDGFNQREHQGAETRGRQHHPRPVEPVGCADRVSGTRQIAIARTTSASGRLMKKIQRQESAGRATRRARDRAQP